MHGFIYYASGIHEPHPKRDAIERWGLGYALGDGVVRRGVMRGPDAMQGVVLARPDCGDLGYYAERQTWRQIPPALLTADAPAVWVGHSTAHKLTPDDLARPAQLAGHAVELDDGQRWQCPAAIAIDDAELQCDAPRKSSTLPRRSALGSDGVWRRDAMHDTYRPLWQVATDYWQAFHEAIAGGDDDDAVQFTFNRAHEAAVICLAANYYLGPAECDLLGLLDENTITRILEAAIDWPTYRRWLQKKSALAPVGSASSAGLAD